MEEYIVNLTKLNHKLMYLNIKYAEEIERLNSIVKEAREFIKYDIKQLKGSEFLIRKLDLKELLEILDKVGSDKE